MAVRTPNAYISEVQPQRTAEQRKALQAERLADGVLAMAEYRAAEVQTRTQTERLRNARLARKAAETLVFAKPTVVAKPAAPVRRRKAVSEPRQKK